MRRRRRLVVAVTVLALAGIAVFVLRPGPDLREGSEALPEGDVDVAERLPSSYRIVYRVENRAGDEVVVSTERLWVRRPFEARVESWSGPPPGDERTSTSINAFARLDAGQAVFAVPPAPAPEDFRVDAAGEQARRAGYLEIRERRRVAGRVCRVYRRAGETPSGTLVRLGEEDGDTFTDTCFDEAGLALEEVGFVDGGLSSRKVAVEVEEDPSLDDDLFEVGEPTLEVRQGGGAVREVEVGSRPPGTFWETTIEPAGFERMGRYAVVPPQTGFDDPIQRPGIITFVSDVWLRGDDVIIVEQGSTLGGRAPFGADPNARRMEGGDLGEGELLYGLRASEVRFLLGGGRFVRVLGTVEPSRLVAVATSLEETEGGSLVYLDEAP